ncbi:sensor histidine kinase [Halocola ammonii]
MSRIRWKLTDSYRRVMAFTLIAVIVIATFITVNNYYTQISIFEEKELTKLKGIASTLAMQIDAKDHLTLLNRYEKKDDLESTTSDSLYFAMHKKLKKAQEVNELESPIYTMIYDSSRHKFCLAVTSAEYPYWKHEYRNFPDRLLEQYETGGVLPPYEDENGVWLSAFVPLKTEDGKITGALQVDERFDNYIARSRDQIWWNIGISLIVIILISIVMIVNVRSLFVKQRKISEQRDEVEALRRELIANVSHDLRTPLASIHGYIETLLLKKDDLDSERFTKYLRTSLNNTEKLKNLVEELFELSKLEAQERKLEAEPLNVGELIHDILNNFKITAGEKKLRLEAKIPVDLPQVKADIALIDRVFQNLISNSIKFCEEGDQIEVSAKHQGELVWITVSDTGKGIAKEDLPHIFNRFHQGTEKKQGAGLGLAIVKNILELHESEFHVKSELNKGTSFSFSLPVLQNSDQ